MTYKPAKMEDLRGVRLLAKDDRIIESNESSALVIIDRIRYEGHGKTEGEALSELLKDVRRDWPWAKFQINTRGK